MNGQEFYNLNKDDETEKMEQELIAMLKQIGASDEEIEKMLSEAREKCFKMAEHMIKKGGV